MGCLADSGPVGFDLSQKIVIEPVAHQTLGGLAGVVHPRAMAQLIRKHRSLLSFGNSGFMLITRSRAGVLSGVSVRGVLGIGPSPT